MFANLSSHFQHGIYFLLFMLLGIFFLNPLLQIQSKFSGRYIFICIRL